MNEPKLISFPHDPECIWCRLGIAPSWSQLTRLGAASRTRTALSHEDLSTPADRLSTSDICSPMSGLVRASGSWPTPASTCQPSSSTAEVGQSQPEQPDSLMPSTRTPLASTSPGGSCISENREAPKVGPIVGGEGASRD